MTAPATSPQTSHGPWADFTTVAPAVTGTMRRYLEQVAVILRPASVQAADLALRTFCRFLTEREPAVSSVAQIDRGVIEDYKLHLAAAVTRDGKPLATNTIRQRLRLLKIFFDRVIEWDWPEAPRRNPILLGDIPPRPEPLPKFLDDAQSARFHSRRLRRSGSVPSALCAVTGPHRNASR